jgi:hypothetical protein
MRLLLLHLRLQAHRPLYHLVWWVLPLGQAMLGEVQAAALVVVQAVAEVVVRAVARTPSIPLSGVWSTELMPIQL